MKLVLFSFLTAELLEYLPCGGNVDRRGMEEVLCNFDISNAGLKVKEQSWDINRETVESTP